MTLIYQSIDALMRGVEKFPPAGGIYTKPKIDRKTIMDAKFVVIPSMEIEECTDEQGGYIPVQLEGKGYHEWLEAAMVREIIRYKLERAPRARSQELIEAIFHYLEYDTFEGA